jgi:hypothetical protein
MSMGRMSKKKRTLLAALEQCGGNISEACKAAKTARSTFYEWLHTDEGFSEQVEAIRESLVDFAESKLMGLIAAGDTTAIIFFLKTRGKSRGYSERMEVEHSVNEVRFID